ITPREVTEVALKVKALIDAVVPIELKESRITRPGGSVITPEVLDVVRQAAPGRLKPCLIYSLLVCNRWYYKLKRKDLFDADLNELKMVACEMVAKRIIEAEEDEAYLFQEMLCRRFATLSSGEATPVRNVLEIAVDVHALNVIGSSGYQRCITYIWQGWIIQSPLDPTEYISYNKTANTSFWAHFDSDRMKAPKYQNWFQLAVSIVYLGLYTGAVNTANPNATFDPVEELFYVFTLGFLFDEIGKFYKVGRHYFSFWSVFNDSLYFLIVISFILHLIAAGKPRGTEVKEYYDVLSYQFLAFCAPMVWSRLLLFLDMQEFIGAMIVVLKELMKESLIFFVLLLIIAVGFLQGFIGLDSADGYREVSGMSIAYMVRSVLQSPEFDPFVDFAPPFASILYYLFTFVVSVVLLNILIALFNSAYENIYENATDEFMALYAQKTLRFVRAPDENLFIPPLNLIEIFGLILPFEWWMSRATYAHLNDVVMKIIYSPVLVGLAFYEVYMARRVLQNRSRGESDDDHTDEWDDVESEINLEGCGWVEKVMEVAPHASQDPALHETRHLQQQVQDLAALVK
ncbi:uncharacterized protein V1510DRAFT_346603, partial [Dipodascopsis tothii]|uniref:uncharacterized protein n=1 Tax=Dipodascopsis tothii TaxID=44089 RepID=UPI0034CD73D7